jgi:hypothetical protein
MGKKSKSFRHVKKMQERRAEKARKATLYPKNYTGIAEYYNGTKYWYLNGMLHRLDGPAVEHYSGYKRWYLNGINYPEEEWFELLNDDDKEKAIWNLR